MRFVSFFCIYTATVAAILDLRHEDGRNIYCYDLLVNQYSCISSWLDFVKNFVIEVNE